MCIYTYIYIYMHNKYMFFFGNDMQLILSHTSAAARPKLVTYFHFGVR